MPREVVYVPDTWVYQDERDPDKFSWGIPKGFSAGGDSEFSSWH